MSFWVPVKFNPSNAPLSFALEEIGKDLHDPAAVTRANREFSRLGAHGLYWYNSQRSGKPDLYSTLLAESATGAVVNRTSQLKYFDRHGLWILDPTEPSSDIFSLYLATLYADPSYGDGPAALTAA